jgi:hypothetical protein
MYLFFFFVFCFLFLLSIAYLVLLACDMTVFTFTWTAYRKGISTCKLLELVTNPFVYLDVQFNSRIFHLYGDVTITGEGQQNLGLCSALRAFEQGGISIVPHLPWHGASIFPVSSEGPPHLIASYDSHGDEEDLFLPGSSRVHRCHKFCKTNKSENGANTKL